MDKKEFMFYTTNGFRTGDFEHPMAKKVWCESVIIQDERGPRSTRQDVIDAINERYEQIGIRAIWMYPDDVWSTFLEGFEVVDEGLFTLFLLRSE